MTKYKIRLSFNTYNSLMGDMYLFEFLKPNGEPNKNAFLLQVISGFHNKLTTRRKKITSLLLDNFSKKISDYDYIKKVSGEIHAKINEYHFSDTLFNTHPYSVHVQVTKDTEALFDKINENELKNETMSEYIRNIFNEYVHLPLYEREICLFWNLFDTIFSYIEEKSKFKIYTMNGSSFIFEGIGFYYSKEETHNYLVGRMTNHKGSTFSSIKLSKIHKVIPLEEKIEISPEDYEEIKKKATIGPEFICKETTHAVIYFSNDGKKLFDKCYKDRPMLTEIIDENNYVFDTGYFNLYNYFKQFGKLIKVIEPKKLKDELYNFHKEALE